MQSKEYVKYIVGSISIVIGTLILIGTFLPIASGLIDFGIYGFSLSGSFGFNFYYITVQYNPLFNNLSAVHTAPLEPYWVFLWSLTYPFFYNTLFNSTTFTLLAVLILIITIAVIILGILNVFFGDKSSAPSIICLVAGGIVIGLSILEFIMFRNKIVLEIKILHEMISLMGGTIWPESTISASPLGGFYLTFIPALGIIGLSIFSVAFIHTQKREGETVGKEISKKKIYGEGISETKISREVGVEKELKINYCPNCGEKIESPSQKYCQNCGHKL